MCDWYLISLPLSDDLGEYDCWGVTGIITFARSSFCVVWLKLVAAKELEFAWDTALWWDVVPSLPCLIRSGQFLENIQNSVSKAHLFFGALVCCCLFTAFKFYPRNSSKLPDSISSKCHSVLLYRSRCTSICWTWRYIWWITFSTTRKGKQAAIFFRHDARRSRWHLFSCLRLSPIIVQSSRNGHLLQTKSGQLIQY